MAAAHEVLIEARDAASALALAAGLGWWWYHRGTFAQGRQALATALELPDHEPTPGRAQALTAAARLAYYDNDIATAVTTSAEAVHAGRAVGDPRILGYALQIHGLALQGIGDGKPWWSRRRRSSAFGRRKTSGVRRSPSSTWGWRG